MSNPFDALDVARDLVRRDECERLFKTILAEQDLFRTNPTEDTEYDKGLLRGMELTLNILDEEIGWLRDRWG